MGKWFVWIAVPGEEPRLLDGYTAHLGDRRLLHETPKDFGLVKVWRQNVNDTSD
jgi:hypothetical protein